MAYTTFDFFSMILYSIHYVIIFSKNINYTVLFNVNFNNKFGTNEVQLIYDMVQMINHFINCK